MSYNKQSRKYLKEYHLLLKCMSDLNTVDDTKPYWFCMTLIGERVHYPPHIKSFDFIADLLPVLWRFVAFPTHNQCIIYPVYDHNDRKKLLLLAINKLKQKRIVKEYIKQLKQLNIKQLK